MKDRDVPLYAGRAEPGGFTLISLPAGATTGITQWNPFQPRSPDQITGFCRYV